MARIRTIKPEFFTSEDIVGLSPLARLLFIGLWCEADKEGRMAWKPKTFKMRYLPADDCNVEALCDELVSLGVVKLYGDGLAYVPSFTTHQHINPRESASSLPDPASKSTRAPRVSTRADTVPDAQGGREGREGDSRDDDATKDPAPLPVALIPLIDGTDFAVFASKAEEWRLAYPAVDVPQKLLAIRQWCIANPTRRKTRRGAETFVVSWLSKEQDSGKGGGKGAGSRASTLDLIGGI